MSTMDPVLFPLLAVQARPNMRRQMSVDTKSYELAEYFLQDFRSIQQVDIQALAEDIQRAVEDFIGQLEEDR